jgi:plasmid stabilization system protein ParE
MIVILKAAQYELDDAFDYYKTQKLGLGYDFIEEFEKCIHRIEQFPEAWQPFTSNTRRCQFNRFPYATIYYLNNSEILIMAIAHLHREPTYWQNRLINIKY